MSPKLPIDHLGVARIFTTLKSTGYKASKAVEPGIQMEAFRDFVLLKGYDVISGGQFRKHVSASKERGDAWACAMQAHHSTTSNTVKEILASLLSMKDNHFRDLQVLSNLFLTQQPFRPPAPN